MDPVLNEANQKIDQTLLHLQRDLSSIRAGRANPQLVEEVPVMAYGARMKMMEVGTISTPQPSLLIIQVWDAGLVKDVQKAIMEANLGLNPSVEGNIIRLPIPPLTEERRDEFIKLAHQKAEAAKVSVRQIRGEERDNWKKAEDQGEFGEDELSRREKLLQDLIDRAIAQIEELTKKKEEELRQI
jgi:ribosome recycling factor